MSGAASKAVSPTVRYDSLPAAVATPKGLELSSRGQGNAFGARRPRIASLPSLPTLKRSKGSAPRQLGVGTVRVLPPLSTHGQRELHAVAESGSPRTRCAGYRQWVGSSGGSGVRRRTATGTASSATCCQRQNEQQSRGERKHSGTP